MASLAAIALRAGVSHMTVSRVLSGKQKGLRTDASDRADEIRRIADELGYRPDPTARALRRGRTGIVALLGGAVMSMDVANTEDIEVMRSLSNVLFSAYSLHLATQLDPRDNGGFDVPPWGVDGAVIMHPCSVSDCQAVEQAKIPYVTINGPCGPNGAAVLLDDVHGMTMALDHLLGLGHRRISYLGYEAAGYQHPSTTIRRETYLRVLLERGVSTVPGFDWGLDDWRGRMTEVVEELTRDNNVTAFVTHSHWQAYQIYEAAARLGLSIPTDLSVVTFNDTWAGSQLMRPTLTAVARPAVGMATTAAALLSRKLLKGTWRTRSETLQEELRVRGSTVRHTCR